VKWTVLWMIINTYCLVFTLRLIVRLTKINFLIARLIAIKNFNRTAAPIFCKLGPWHLEVWLSQHMQSQKRNSSSQDSMVPLQLLSFFFIYSVTVLQTTVVSGSLLIWIRQFCPFFTCRDHINQKLRRDHMLQWNQCTYNLLSQFLLLTIHKSINNVNQYHSPNLLPVHMVGVKCSKRMHLCTLCMQCDFVTNSNICRQIKKIGMEGHHGCQI